MFNLKKLISPPAGREAETFDGVPETLEHEYLPHPDSRELAVVLSPAANVARYISGAARNTLYLSDRSQSFYVTSIAATAEAVARHVERRGITKTLLVGGSKAGFAALVLTGVCARAQPDHPFRCLALSPHTRIYPHNPNLDLYLVYRSLMKRAANSADLRSTLERYGDAKVCENLTNAFVMLVYGEANLVDREEAERLLGFNIRKYPLPFGFHSTKTALLIQEQPARLRRRAIEKIFATMQRTEETRSSIPATPELLALQIEQTSWLPSMSEMIAEVMRV